MNDPIVLTSALDASVNFIEKTDIGFLEHRYVRRDLDKVLVYLSSQTGCSQACRFCHLTANGEVALTNATLADFLRQASTVLAHYDNQAPGKTVHFNFMARGEPLANHVIFGNSGLLLSELGKLAEQRGLVSKYLISTIMPSAMGGAELRDIFSEVHPEIYYSLYSINPSFRRRWLNKAHTAEVGLDKLKDWADYSGKVPKIHFAFIEGQNDSEADIVAIANALKTRELTANFNIVRYNPASEKYGRESSEDVIERNVGILKELLNPPKVRVVPKVGFDVKASCGMFINSKDPASLINSPLILTGN